MKKIEQESDNQSQVMFIEKFLYPTYRYIILVATLFLLPLCMWYLGYEVPKVDDFMPYVFKVGFLAILFSVVINPKDPQFILLSLQQTTFFIITLMLAVLFALAVIESYETYVYKVERVTPISVHNSDTLVSRVLIAACANRS